MESLNSVMEYDLVSFDIFDTLLFRTTATPSGVFEKTWEAAGNLKLTDISPQEFAKLRIEMERRARNKKKTREVNLEEIYQECPVCIASDITKLQELEIETERECCYVNGFIYGYVRSLHEADKKVVLISDMYLSSRAVKYILKANGIDISVFDGVFISNEEECGKQDGSLFDVLFSKFPGIRHEKMLHIGDNRNSDYVQAVKKGMSAVHYDAIPDKLNSIYDYERIRHNVPQPGILSLRKSLVYNNSGRFKEGIQRNAYETGASVVGPFLVMFTSHVCSRLKELGIKSIYPLMREGYILGKLLEAEAAYRRMDLEVHPLYISRKVTYIPSIEKINREEIENMIGARNLTVEESVKLMGLDWQWFSDVSNYAGMRWKDSHKVMKNGITLKEYLVGRFLEEDNIKVSERYIKEQRGYLVRYLKHEIGDFNNAATIDIGYFGRIQMWMEKALSLEGIKCKMKHFLAVGVTGDKVYDGMDFEGYYGTFAENGDLIPVIHRTADLLEKFISSTEGSTIGYKENLMEGKIEPVKDKEVANSEVVMASFQGILDFQKAFHCFAKRKPAAAADALERRRETLMLMHRLVDMPRLCEAELAMSMEADTNFGTMYRKQVITDENMSLLREKGKDFIDKCNVSYTYQDNNIVWPKGVVTLADEYYYVRRALKNSAGNEIAKSMQEVVEKVQSDGVSEIALYGAGENGRQFYFICGLYNINVNCFIDRKESLWGTRKEGIEVMGLREAMDRGNDVYIVTSLFSISEISAFIKENYKGTERCPVIYSV